MGLLQKRFGAVRRFDDGSDDVGFQPHDDTTGDDASYAPRPTNASPITMPSPSGENGDPGDHPFSGTHLDAGYQQYLRQGTLPPAPDVATAAPVTASTSTSEPVSAASGSGSTTPGGGIKPAATTPVNDEDQIFSQVMKRTMDDTPSRNRISQMEAQDAKNHQPMGWKKRLLMAGIMAAPAVVGGLVDGTAGVSGGAEGASEMEQTMHDRAHTNDMNLHAQIEAERQRQERQWERQQQLPITYMNMKMTRDYRNRTLGLKGQDLDRKDRETDIKAQMADAAGKRAVAMLHRTGLSADGVTPIPYDQMDEHGKASVDYLRARQGLTEAQDEFTQAKTKNMPEQMELARQKLARAGQAHDIALMNFNAKYRGMDNDGNVLPGAPMDDDGAVYGFAAAPWLKPSMQSRSRADQGDAVTAAGDELVGWIGQHKKAFGNVNAIIQSAFLGTPLADPEEAEAAARVASYAALQPALHGFRGQDALREFMKIIGGLPKDADSLIASINGIRSTAQIVSKAGKMEHAPGAQPGQPTPAAAPKASKKLSKGGVIKWVDGPDGKPMRAGATN